MVFAICGENKKKTLNLLRIVTILPVTFIRKLIPLPISPFQPSFQAPLFEAQSYCPSNPFSNP